MFLARVRSYLNTEASQEHILNLNVGCQNRFRTFSLSVPYAQENDPNAFLIFVRAGSKGNIEKRSEIVFGVSTFEKVTYGNNFFHRSR